MKNQFNSFRLLKPKKNNFDLSFQNKFTAKFGQLIPFMVQDTLPGDTFKVSSKHAIRLQPTVAPIMQNVEVCKHYFFVPFRLIWSHWESFITGGESGTEDPEIPYFKIENVNDDAFKSFTHAGSLADYLGFPTPDTDNHTSSGKFNYNMLPFLAYQLIWQEYYRDQNVMNKLSTNFPFNGTGAVQTTSVINDLMTIRKRCWRKDEFTSALPWPQRGATVDVPFTIKSTVINSTGASVIRTTNTSNPVYEGSNHSLYAGTVPSGGGRYINVTGDTAATPLQIDVSKHTKVSSTVEGNSVTNLRRALASQQFLERLAIGGSRYIEVIKSFFGINSSDARLQRPQYLGGSVTPLVMEALAQTSQSNTTSVQGNLSGNGGSASSDFIFKANFEEHGFVIGILSVIPRASYCQGTPQKYLREDRTEFYWPQFAHIGEQAIKEHRIYTDWNFPLAGKTFGYEPRYAEYRFNNDEIHGEFRTNLKQWHMGRIFETAPSLNISFLNVQESVANRVMAVNDFLAAPLLCQVNNDIKASRYVSLYGDTLPASMF